MHYSAYTGISIKCDV